MNFLSRLATNLALVFVLGFGLALAQSTPAPRPSAEALKQLDGVRATLEQIDASLHRADLTDGALLELRGRLEPLTPAAQVVLEDLEPRLDAVKARLEQLGPKPGEKAPPEAASVSSEREEQQRQFDDIDGAMKRARLVLVQIGQAGDTVVARRRALFTRALFTRTFSLVSPELWTSAARVLPGEARAIATVTSDWASNIAARLAGWSLVVFLPLTAAIAALYNLATRVERRVIFRDPGASDPGDLRKAAAALWSAAVTAAVPIVAAMAFLALTRSFDLINARVEPLVGALFDAVTRVALTLGIARGVLAPGMPAWRLVDWSEATIGKARHLALSVVIVLSIGKVMEACGEIIVASLPVSIVLRGLGAVAVAGVLGFGLKGVSATPSDDECLGPVVAPARDWTTTMRVAAWITAATILGSALVGYIAFASFLADQLVWVTFIVCSFFLVSRFAQRSIAIGLRPQSKFGRLVVANVGLRRESLDQISILLSGLVSLGLTVAAIMLSLAPWGVESNDMLANFRAAFFGFKVGDVTISLSSILVGVVIFTVGWALARALQRWLEARFLPHTQLDVGLRNSIKTSVGYVGFIIAASLALSYLGLGFEKLAIVAGALSVGIGFGLQSIVNNFVSGLILLWERAIRVGDWVVVGDEQGYVRRINVRSTEIETFDRATMIVPNANLVSGVVKNWVRNDRVGRIKNSVAVNIGADPEKVRDALLACARAHDLVMKAPAPQVMFISMTDNMLRFDLVCFVEDVERAGRIKSDLNFAIFKSFGDAGLDLLTTPLAPPPTMTGLDRAESLIARGLAGG